MLIKLKHIAFCLFLLPLGTNGQGTNGKDFWVAYMSQDWRCSNVFFYNHRDTPKVYVSSRFAAKVTIKVDKFNFNRTITLQPQKTTIVYLPCEMASEYTDTIIANSAHIIADTFINVHAVNNNGNSTGSTIVIPSESIPLSPEYILTTYEDGAYFGWLCEKKRIQTPEFTIVGIADSSVIEVIPSGASWRSKAKVPFQITLRKGETFHLLSSDLDLTGSVIRSKYLNSKFSVFAGNRATGNFKDGCNTGWDNMLEQMTPTVCWGQYYTAIPFINNSFGYALKIVAAENKTSLFINGNYITLLDQGECYFQRVYKDTVTQIKASNKISVAQVALGGCRSRKDSMMGDMAMVMLFPDNQMGTAATVNTIDPETKGWYFLNLRIRPEHNLNVITKSSDTAYFMLENKKPANSVWKTAGNISGYHYAQLKLDSGCYDLTSSKGFLAYVYGYSPAEGYAYAAAANYKLLQNNFIVTNAQCVKDTTNFRAIENDSFVNYSWTFGDNSAMAYGPKVKHKYKDTGWYTVVMYCYQKRTNDKDSVTKVIYIADTKVQSLFGKDTLICGKLNYVQMSKGFQYGNVYRWNDGWSLYYKLIKDTGLYWLNMQQRNGCVLRDTLRVYGGAFPHSSFTVSNDTFCLNRRKETSFRNYSTSRDSVNYYTWDFGADVIKTKNKDTVFSYNFPKAGTFPVILRTTTLKGCYQDTFLQIEVLNSPQADFVFSEKDTCLNSNHILLQNKTLLNPTYHKRYKWYFSEGYVLSNSNPGVRKYSGIGNYYVLLIYENNNGCIDTMRKTVRIVANPKAGFRFSKSMICPNDTLTLDNTSASTHSPMAYRWEFGDSTYSTDSTARKTWTAYGPFKTRLVVTDPTGCKDSISDTIRITAPPLADFKVNQDTQCLNRNQFTLSNSTKFITGPLTYTWNMGDGHSRNDSNIVNYTYQSDSVYSIQLNVSYGHVCKAKVEKTVYVGKEPEAGFKIDNPRQCFRNHVFNFTNQSRVNKGLILYNRWDLGDGSQSDSTDIYNKTYSSEDTFDIRLIVESNYKCRDTAHLSAITFAQPAADFQLANDTLCWQKNTLNPLNKTRIKYGKISSHWNFGDGNTSDDFQVNKTYKNTTRQYIIQYNAVSEHGCSDSIRKTFTVLERPLANFGVNDSIQCLRTNEFRLQNNTTFSVPGSLKYRWDYANGDSSTGLNANSITYSKPGKYPVRLIALSTITNCYDTIYKTLIAAPQARLKFNVNADSQCLRFNQFAFTNNSSVEFGSLKWLWRFGDGSTDTATNPKKSYKQEGAYDIRLIATSNYDCSDSSEMPIGFYPTPHAGFAINDTAQCLNKHGFDFTNTSTLSFGTYSSDWWFDDSSNSSARDVKGKQFTSGEFHQVRLAVQSDKACKDTALRIVYLEKTHNTFIDFPENAGQCLIGNLFHFRPLIKNKKVTNSSYSWDFGDGSSSVSDIPAPKSFATDSTYKIRLISLSMLGCLDTAYSTEVIHPHPVSAFTCHEVCYPEPVLFENQSKIKSGTIVKSNWYFGDGGLSSDQNPSHAYKSFGQYDVTLITVSDFGCKNELTLNGVAKVKEKPQAGFSFSFLRTNTIDETWVQFKNQSRGAVNYQWDFGNQTYSRDNNPYTTYKDTGRFKVMLIAISSNGCSDTSTVSTGFIAPDLHYFLPNAFSPDGNSINEVYKGVGSRFIYSFNLQIFNRWGEKLFETTDINQGWDGTYQGTPCMEGVYLCKVKIVPFKGTMKVYEQTFTLLR